jgi:hypothetical protein
MLHPSPPLHLPAVVGRVQRQLVKPDLCPGHQLRHDHRTPDRLSYRLWAFAEPIWLQLVAGVIPVVLLALAIVVRPIVPAPRRPR